MALASASISRCAVALAFSFVLLVVAIMPAHAQTETVLYNFCAKCADGWEPAGSLIADSAGNLYGTTYAGGTAEFGTVFELSPSGGGSWTKTVLYSFTGGTDGGSPIGSLVFDSAGNLYGTTMWGGDLSCSPNPEPGCGTVFELSPDGKGNWTEQVLHSFNGSDGNEPVGGLIFDAAGNLYGITTGGNPPTAGTVFELFPNGSGSWNELTLHAFTFKPDGSYPFTSLVFDGAGNLYGTTYFGGKGTCFHGYGCGTVFELTPGHGGAWAEKLIFLPHGVYGSHPTGGLVFDPSGNLYFTSSSGGGLSKKGVVVRLAPAGKGTWTPTALHAFAGGTADGNGPQGVVLDSFGNLFGTTAFGGMKNCSPHPGCGTVYELSPNGNGYSEKILWTFNGSDGANPADFNLIMDRSGNLYGTTQFGGASGYGTVFELTP